MNMWRPFGLFINISNSSLPPPSQKEVDNTGSVGNFVIYNVTKYSNVLWTPNCDNAAMGYYNVYK